MRLPAIESDRMKISVAICTWNRSRLLTQTLTNFVELTIPESVEWELIVVDNNSTDDTKQVIQRFADKLPIRYLFENQQGHSYSRNAAVQSATGELILWTDNDVIVDPGWLAAFADGANRYPAASFFGGKIEPVFETARPQWLAWQLEKCKSVYAARDLGNDAFELKPDQFPYGAALP